MRVRPRAVLGWRAANCERSQNKMLLYILKRLLYVTPVAFGVSIVCFLLVHIAPGDPLSAILPADAPLSLQEQMKAAYGFRSAAAGPIRQVGCGVPCRVISAPSIANGPPGVGRGTRGGGQHADPVRRGDADRLHLRHHVRFCGRVLPRFPGPTRWPSALSVFGVSVPHYWLGMVLVIIFSAQLGWAAVNRAAGPGGLRGVAAEFRASALHHPARDHHVGDPDGHHLAHRARPWSPKS